MPLYPLLVVSRCSEDCIRLRKQGGTRDNGDT
jgi:hypothetical protein